MEGMSREEVEAFILTCDKPSGPNAHDGTIVEVVYESFKAQSQGLEPHPKTYTGIFEGTKTNISGDFIFVLGKVRERGGQFRSFNPSKGFVLSLTKVTE